jgi:2-succinyl-6-hydroxy-2,4-cyclohexadiene-1-carboxylate synthase
MPLDHGVRRFSATPLCWLHGFTQTGSSAHLFQSILAARRVLITPDLARHGSQALEGGTLDEIADRIARQLPEHIVDLGGYSFGARVALHLALRHPDRVRRLVLIGATRGIEDATKRDERRDRDERLAQRMLDIGLEAFLDEWLSQPMFAQLHLDAEERRARETQRIESLAASLREAGTGTQRWLGEEIRTLTMPLLALAGASDERFSRESRYIADAVPGGVAQLVPGSGHATHLHQPEWSAHVIDSFLSHSVDEIASDTQ